MIERTGFLPIQISSAKKLFQKKIFFASMSNSGSYGVVDASNNSSSSIMNKIMNDENIGAPYWKNSSPLASLKRKSSNSSVEFPHSPNEHKMGLSYVLQSSSQKKKRVDSTNINRIVKTSPQLKPPPAPSSLSPYTSEEVVEETYWEGLQSSQSMLESFDFNHHNSSNEENDDSNYSVTPVPYINLVLHPEVAATLSAQEAIKMRKYHLDRIELSSTNKNVCLRRETYAKIFNQSSYIDVSQMSRLHCKIGYERLSGKTYLEDTSSNGIRIGKEFPGKLLGKGRRKMLVHGDTVYLLLKNKTGRMQLAYVVHDPYAAVVAETTTVDDRNSTEVTTPAQSRRLGVVFCSPLVSRAFNGTLNSLPSLAVSQMYSSITASMKDAVQRRLNQRGDTYDSLDICIAFGTSAILNQMLSCNCTVVHFAAFGNDSHLFLEDGRTTSVHAIPYESLLDIVTGDDHLRCNTEVVVVNTKCSLRVAKAFLAAGVQCVVAIELDDPVNDRASVEFIASFYHNVGSGKSIQSSFECTTNDLKEKGIYDAHKVSLLCQNNIETIITPLPIVMRTVVDDKKTKDFMFEVAELCPAKLPAVCNNFSERNDIIHKICSKLISQSDHLHRRSVPSRFFRLFGSEGIGKTQIAYAVARELLDASIDALKSTVVVVPGTSSPSFDRILRGVRAMLCAKLQKLTEETNDEALVDSLFIFDGMHHLTPVQVQSLYGILTTILAQYIRVKVLVTTREVLKSERFRDFKSFEILPLVPEAAARLLIELTPRPIKFFELRLPASNVNDTEYEVSVVATHPEVQRTRGNPKLIAKLAETLASYRLDDLYRLRR